MLKLHSALANLACPRIPLAASSLSATPSSPRDWQVQEPGGGAEAPFPLLRPRHPKLNGHLTTEGPFNYIIRLAYNGCYLGEVVLPELEPEVSVLLPEVPELLLLPLLPLVPELPVLESDPLEPLLLPPGVNAPPVAELLPDKPK